MLFGLAIQQQPEYEPDESERAGDNECPAPTPVNRDPRHNERSNYGAHVCSGVENSCRQGSLSLREPLGDGFDACWEDSGLSETQG